MPKNLVILHLESISNTILWQYRVELGTVWRLMQESLSYSRFNSNATSTIMVVNYFFNGETFVGDYYSHYKDDIPHPGNLGMPIFHYLLQNGYEFRNYILDYYLRQDIEDGFNIIHSAREPFFAAMRKHMTDAIAAGKPFALYLNDETSHMALDNAEKATAPTFSERFRRSYRGLDANVHQVLSLLIELGQWDNTVIVGYGDHGDELWSHALNRGFCHGTPPYASLTWTPLFIFESGRQPGTTDQLIGLSDLRETLIKRLLPDYEPAEDRFRFDYAPFSGMDMAKNEREYVFSQNLYALQLEYDDPEQALTKGYSVTDGVYRLVATSGGEKARDGGLEFYCDRLDPTNSRNLLDFFILDFRGDPIGFRPPPEATAPEFGLIFNPEAVKHLMEKYRAMKQALEEHVRLKESTALPHNRGRRHHVMPEGAFAKIRKRMHRG